MKRLLLLGITFGVVAVSLEAQAQTAKEGGFYMSIHGGYNATVAGASGIDYVNVLGLAGMGQFMIPANMEDDKIETPSYSYGKGLMRASTLATCSTVT